VAPIHTVVDSAGAASAGGFHADGDHRVHPRVAKDGAVTAERRRRLLRAHGAGAALMILCSLSLFFVAGGAANAMSQPASHALAALDPNNCGGAWTPPGASPSPTASPSPSPSPGVCVGLQAVPNTGLADGQYVKLNFLNLQPFEAMVFREC